MLNLFSKVFFRMLTLKKKALLFITIFTQNVYIFLFNNSLFICLYILLYTKWWPMLLLYFCWIYLDRKSCDTGGKHLLKLLTEDSDSPLIEYFPIEVHGVQNLDLKPYKNYMLINLPHGMYAFGISNLLASQILIKKLFPYHIVYFAITTISFFAPFSREIVILGKHLVSSSAECINFLLGRLDGGNIVTITPDGAEGMLLVQKGRNRCYLNKRKGFIKLALKNGSPIIPSYTFGEVDLYDVLFETPAVRKIQRWIKDNTKIVVKFTKSSLGYYPILVPYKKPLNIVFGEPIEVEKKVNPTNEDVELLHATFVEKLTELFEKYKGKFIVDAENVQLEIV